MKTVLVTGATGTVGRALSELLATSVDVRVLAATRHPDSLDAGRDRLRPIRFDWNSPDPIADEVARVDGMFLLPPPAQHPLATTRRLLDAAAASGVAHVVFLSTLGADFEPGFAFGRWALEAERAVARSGLAYTVLRPNSFMTNFKGMLGPDDSGALRLPWASGASSFVDPHDVAEVAAHVLMEPGRHAGLTYQLTGPEALDTEAIAAILSGATGRDIRYVDVPAAVVRAAMSEAGTPAPIMDALLELHAVMASGARAGVTDDVQRVTGREPRSLRAFASENLSAWTRPTRARRRPDWA